MGANQCYGDEVYFSTMIAEHELQERLTRLEQEVDAIKQQLSALQGHSAPHSALDLLEQLWQVGGAERPPLPLAEAREQLAHGLPLRWGSLQVKRQRRRQ